MGPVIGVKTGIIFLYEVTITIIRNVKDDALKTESQDISSDECIPTKSV